MGADHGSYYLPEPSKWPLVGSIGMFCMLGGAALWLHETFIGPYLMFFGMAILVYMMIGWFGQVIRESEEGLYDDQVDRTFRWGMAWFIFTEVMFFAAFFGVLFYARVYSVPWLGGEGSVHHLTHYLIWPGFNATWPVIVNPNPGDYVGPLKAMEAWGVPAFQRSTIHET